MEQKGDLNRVKEWLLRYGTITSWEAIEAFGCTRLPVYISKLRKSGWEIETKLHDGKDRFGEKTHYARYHLRRIK